MMVIASEGMPSEPIGMELFDTDFCRQISQSLDEAEAIMENLFQELSGPISSSESPWLNVDQISQKAAISDESISRIPEPTPIASHGVSVVERIQLKDTPLFRDEQLWKNLSPLLNAMKQKSTSQLPSSSSNSMQMARPSPVDFTMSAAAPSRNLKTAKQPTPAEFAIGVSALSHNQPGDAIQQVITESSYACSEENELSTKEDFTEDGSDSVDSEASANLKKFRPYQFEQWHERFQELEEFKQKHGHCLVPVRWKENLPLALWVKRQRYQYRLKAEGKHSTLTDARQEALSNLGFVWNSRGISWELRFEELRRFKESHGHCDISYIVPQNSALSIWVKCQRRQYKLYTDGKPSSITKERIKRLSDLGFLWNPRKLK